MLSKLVSVTVLLAVMFVPALSVSFLPKTTPASADLLAVYHGTIASGPQYDLYKIQLRANAGITALTNCEGAPTLDTILTVYFPGVDPSSTGNANVYNDDGGPQVCGGFHNSLATFTAPVAGEYTFRVDGFGSATGDYMLTITDSTGCDALLAFTDTAVVGAFVADTPLYSEPGVMIQPQVIVEAGKTYWVMGVDPTQQYYEIYVSCSRVWVPVSSMEPNYDDVWQGRPLPTNIVESGSK